MVKTSESMIASDFTLTKLALIVKLLFPTGCAYKKGEVDIHNASWDVDTSVLVPPLNLTSKYMQLNYFLGFLVFLTLDLLIISKLLPVL